MKTIAIIALAACAFTAQALGQSTNDYLITRKTSTGVTQKVVGATEPIDGIAAYLIAPFVVDTVEPSESGIGWADGAFTIQTPVGALQFGETGSPLEATLYWPGRFTVGSLEASSITGVVDGALVTTGTIPSAVMVRSIPAPLSSFQDDSSHAGTLGGLTYSNTGPLSSNEAATPGFYFAMIEVTDGGTDTTNKLAGRIYTATQARTLIASPQVVSAPATASSTGTAGQIAYDSSYFYQCISTNTWKRAALSTW